MRFDVQHLNGQMMHTNVLANDPIKAAEIVAEIEESQGPFVVYYAGKDGPITRVIMSKQTIYEGRPG